MLVVRFFAVVHQIIPLNTQENTVFCQTNNLHIRDNYLLNMIPYLHFSYVFLFSAFYEKECPSHDLLKINHYMATTGILLVNRDPINVN